jgi:SAM-dependent methyltransferase
MTASHCAICGPNQPSDLVYPNRLPAGLVSAEAFSARRVPDRMHSEIRRCRTCGLLFATPVPDADELNAGYAVSEMTYAGQLADLRRTYGALLDDLMRTRGTKAGRLLEIGCGSGFVLDEALGRGFSDVAGVEPSVEAVAAASDLVRGRIKLGLFTGREFPPGSFDVVCGFHVFDHVRDPRAMLDGMRRMLAPGGVLLLVMHDAGAWSAKVLGDRSPIFDIAHPYLYNRKTIVTMLEASGFEAPDVFPVRNTYRLEYWAHLTPMPRFCRGIVRAVLDLGPGQWPVTLPAGNMGATARVATAAQGGARRA